MAYEKIFDTLFHLTVTYHLYCLKTTVTESDLLHCSTLKCTSVNSILQHNSLPKRLSENSVSWTRCFIITVGGSEFWKSFPCTVRALHLHRQFICQVSQSGWYQLIIILRPLSEIYYYQYSNIYNSVVDKPNDWS